MGVSRRNAQLLETPLNPRNQHRRQEPTARLLKRDLLLVLQETHVNGSPHLQRKIRAAKNYVSRRGQNVTRPSVNHRSEGDVYLCFRRIVRCSIKANVRGEPKDTTRRYCSSSE